MVNAASQRPGLFLENAIFYVSLLLLAVTVGAFFYVRYTLNQESERLAGLSAQLAQIKSGEQKDLENTINTARQKLADFSKVMKERRSAQNFFNKFEILVPENVYFSQCNLDLGGMSASLAGHGDTFQDASRQMMVFNGASDVLASADLTKATINDDGIVDFEVSIALESAMTSPGQ